MQCVDLNCDVGESFGIYRLGHDEELLPYVTSANIACGFHAGDPATMRKTVQIALREGVAIGAHPGLPDLLGFGRRNLAVSPQEVYDSVLYQVGALWAFVKAEGGELRHVKPHGALYNMAARSAGLAETIALAVYRLDPRLILLGLSGSELLRAGVAAGLTVASEAFADRTYQDDGSLTPREQPDALITDGQYAAQRVVRMIQHGVVHSQHGHDVPVRADTVCIHGDSPHAPLFARRLRESLERAGVTVRALS